MKRVFIDLNEYERDLVIDKLKKHCIRYNITSNNDYAETVYNITVDIPIDGANGNNPYAEITSEIDFSIDKRRSLERAYLGPVAERENYTVVSEKEVEEDPSFLEKIKFRLQGLYISLLNLISGVHPQLVDDGVPFDELPPAAKVFLQNRYPEELLKTDKCKITYKNNVIRVDIFE